MNVRQATPLDAQVVSDILTEAARWLEKAGMPMWREDQLDPAIIVADVAAGLYFLAQLGENPVGTVRFQLEDPAFWPDALPQEAAYIHRFAIRRQYAGTGASTILLHWAVARTREFGRRYLRLDCLASRPRLRAMYESFGFRHRDDRQVGPDFVSRYEYDITKQ
jgi:GNAT superfamily N-acetyltransferase